MQDYQAQGQSYGYLRKPQAQAASGLSDFRGSENRASQLHQVF
jgi:hypothetical protein